MMRLWALWGLAILSVSCAGCSTLAPSTSHDPTADINPSRWTAFLGPLNQPQGSNLPFMVRSYSQDLSELYQSELAIIKAEIKPITPDGATISWLPSQRLAYHQAFSRRVQDFNQTELQRFENPSRFDPPANISRQRATEILDAARNHEVGGLDAIETFSRANEIGFCFGRALLIHALLRGEAVPQEQIFKIFALGEFKVGGIFWQFHVAIIVLTDHGYLVMDPTLDQPKTIGKWIANTNRFDLKSPQPRVRYFITEPAKFMPNPGKYSVETLENKHYGNYFLRLLESLEK